MFYFAKMQATGNDFVLIDCIKEKFEYSFKLLAQFLCDRHFGVGADGILILEKSNLADFKMRIFNSDGSEAEMCGNGIRCFAKYVYEHKLTEKTELTIETIAGFKEVNLKLEGDTVISVKVNMGRTEFDFEKIPVFIDEIARKNVTDNYSNNISKINIDGIDYYPVSMGNPHVVCFLDNIDKININRIGSKIENYKYFPNKTNVEFVQIVNNDNIKVRIWERGVGETLSCGTGVSASAVISSIVKRLNNEIFVNVSGGNLKVKYDFERNQIFLEGDANEVFEGNLRI